MNTNKYCNPNNQGDESSLSRNLTLLDQKEGRTRYPSFSIIETSMLRLFFQMLALRLMHRGMNKRLLLKHMFKEVLPLHPVEESLPISDGHALQSLTIQGLVFLLQSNGVDEFTAGVRHEVPTSIVLNEVGECVRAQPCLSFGTSTLYIHSSRIQQTNNRKLEKSIKEQLISFHIVHQVTWSNFRFTFNDWKAQPMAKRLDALKSRFEHGEWR